MPDASRTAGPAVGVVVPFDFALDRELWRWVPGDATLHVTRTAFVDAPVSLQLAEAVSEHAPVRDATRSVVGVDPDVVVYACTSGSFLHGMAGERRLLTTMRDAGARDAVTTSGALLEALDVLGVRRLAVATPYDADVTSRLHDFLGEAGVHVVSGAHLGLRSHIWTVPYDATTRLVHEADSPGAAAVFVSCTNLPTYDLVAPLEERLGKPVLTANQVTMWAALRRAGATATGDQRLLAAVPARAAGHEEARGRAPAT